MKAALYLRVSTKEQNTENQAIDLRRMAEARGFEVVEVYEEHKSAVKKRPSYERMMKDAHKGRFGVVLVWALDRLGRSMMGTSEAVASLDRMNVRLLSHQEAWIDVDGPVRPLLVAVMAWAAEQERNRLIERTHAGLARAKKAGIKLGRPMKRVDPNEVALLRSQGLAYGAIAKRMGVGESTLYRALQGQA